jgi:hypothetical protein
MGDEAVTPEEQEVEATLRFYISVLETSVEMWKHRALKTEHLVHTMAGKLGIPFKIVEAAEPAKEIKQ